MVREFWCEECQEKIEVDCDCRVTGPSHEHAHAVPGETHLIYEDAGHEEAER